jgi:hemerythrin-like domain-containing protein
MATENLQLRLLHDHLELDALFTRLMDAFQANAREDTQSLWTELERRLERHFQVEERHLFPRFEKLDATETRALREDHTRLRQRLGELGAGVDLKLVRAEVARDFIDMLRAHAKREDELLYRWAREALAADAGTIIDALTS